MTGFGHEDVGGFDIAMDDTLVVGVVERVGDLGEDGESIGKCELFPTFEEAGALDFFHDEEVVGAIDSEVVEANDVFVDEAGEDLGFEPDLAGDFFFLEVFEQFDGDGASEDEIFGAINGAHSASTEFFFDDESTAESFADQVLPAVSGS